MNKNRFTSFAACAVWDIRLTAGDIRVLAALGTYTDNHGFCYPSQKTLAGRLDTTPPTVSKSISKLVEYGYLEKRSTTRPGRGRSGCIYRVRFDQTERELLDAGADLSVSRLRPDDMSGQPDIGIQGGPTSAPGQVGYKDEGSQENIPNTPIVPVTLESVFNSIWLKWPLRGRCRTSKAKVRDQLKNQSKLLSDIEFAVDAYLASADAKKDGGEYVPGLHTWLREKLETWIELSQKENVVKLRPAATHPEWFTKLQFRFEDSDVGADWKNIWSRLEPLEDGNPVVLRAPTEALFQTAARDCQRFFNIVGRPVQIIPPGEASLQR